MSCQDRVAATQGNEDRGMGHEDRVAATLGDEDRGKPNSQDRASPVPTIDGD